MLNVNKRVQNKISAYPFMNSASLLSWWTQGFYDDDGVGFELLGASAEARILIWDEMIKARILI